MVGWKAKSQKQKQNPHQIYIWMQTPGSLANKQSSILYIVSMSALQVQWQSCGIVGVFPAAGEHFYSEKFYETLI